MTSITITCNTEKMAMWYEDHATRSSYIGEVPFGNAERKNHVVKIELDRMYSITEYIADLVKSPPSIAHLAVIDWLDSDDDTGGREEIIVQKDGTFSLTRYFYPSFLQAVYNFNLYDPDFFLEAAFCGDEDEQYMLDEVDGYEWMSKEYKRILRQKIREMHTPKTVYAVVELTTYEGSSKDEILKQLNDSLRMSVAHSPIELETVQLQYVTSKYPHES